MQLGKNLNYNPTPTALGPSEKFFIVRVLFLSNSSRRDAKSLSVRSALGFWMIYAQRVTLPS